VFLPYTIQFQSTVTNIILFRFMEFVMDYALQHVFKFVIQEKYLRNHGLPKLASGPPRSKKWA
jgi:hypothetical protein